MFAFLFVISIMVVDIAALISSSQHPLNTRIVDNRLLTPSQVPSFRKKKTRPATSQKLFVDDARNSLVPSQVSGVRFRHVSSTKIATTAANEVEVDDVNQSKKIETKKKEHQKHGSKNNDRNRNVTSRPDSRNSTARSNGAKGNRKRRQLNTGNFPDVLWRHIPLEHVRKHPLFVPLPDPETIHHLESMEDVRNFRQESWQWDVLHEGRMTTSQAVAALGFLEPLAGEILGVPKGLRRGAEGAYHRLRRPAATRTLEEMNAKLCVDREDDNDDGIKEDDTTDGNDEDDSNYWTQPANYPFAAKYWVTITEEMYENRKNIARNYAKSQKNQWSIRMVWGNVQEATSLLTALNYFWKRDERVLMKEIGMCGAGLKFNQTASQSTGLILGATPDAVLCHPDGRIEAVEVKNHCPFVPNRNHYNRKQSNNTAFRLSRQTLSKTDSIMSQYIPQLMMEMLCLGENCESAIMVRQTATHGSLILRIKRNNDWIEEMKYWLDRFYQDFILQESPPPRNFFLEGGDPVDQARYKEFLELTKQVESDVELLEHVPHRSIQRATAKHPVSMDLFLD
jgi:hypothetical protein